MSTHSTASTHEETPHATNSITNKPISDALKRRAQWLIKDKSIDAGGRTWIRYALEINDPMLSELVSDFLISDKLHLQRWREYGTGLRQGGSFYHVP